MTASQFKKIFAIADANRNIQDDDSILHGCGLSDFVPVVATARQCARMLAWQGLQLNGQWDMAAVNEMKDCFRRKVTVLDLD